MIGADPAYEIKQALMNAHELRDYLSSHRYCTKLDVLREAIRHLDRYLPAVIKWLDRAWAVLYDKDAAPSQWRLKYGNINPIRDDEHENRVRVRSYSEREDNPEEEALWWSLYQAYLDEVRI